MLELDSDGCVGMDVVFVVVFVFVCHANLFRCCCLCACVKFVLVSSFHCNVIDINTSFQLRRGKEEEEEEEDEPPDVEPHKCLVCDCVPLSMRVVALHRCRCCMTC